MARKKIMAEIVLIIISRNRRWLSGVGKAGYLIQRGSTGRVALVVQQGSVGGTDGQHWWGRQEISTG